MVNIWKLIREVFKDDEEVIVITTEDEFNWGKLKMYNSVCVLVKPTGDISLKWEEIRFMSHDGLPIKKLTGADGSKLIELLDTTDTQAFIREALIRKICTLCHKNIANTNRNWCPDCDEKEKNRLVMGDPFMIENFSGKLINIGNTWPPHLDEWDFTFEETIIIKHRGGATGLLWDIDTCYYFETGV